MSAHIDNKHACVKELRLQAKQYIAVSRRSSDPIVGRSYPGRELPSPTRCTATIAATCKIKAYGNHGVL